MQSEDQGRSGEVHLFPMDAVLSGGQPFLDTPDSMRSGAIRLPFTVDSVPASGRMDLSFTFQAMGRSGAAVRSHLRWPGETHADAELVFAVDAAGTLSPSDPTRVLTESYARLSADPVALARVIGVSKTATFAANEFELGYFSVVSPDPKRLYPAECTAAGTLCITGRLAFDDPDGCFSPVPSQQVSWSDCHAFKRHFVAGGAAITGNASAAEALRPAAQPALGERPRLRQHARPEPLAEGSRRHPVSVV